MYSSKKLSAHQSIKCECKTYKYDLNLIVVVKGYMYVVVNFLSQVIIVSLLFLGMLMYANEVETKEE